MAQSGDTITYTYSDGSSVSEDVSNVNEMTIDYIDAAGGNTAGSYSAAAGGRVENVVVDISNYDTIYLWVSNYPNGRYSGGSAGYKGGGSSEVSFVNTNSSDSADEPFIAAAGGGGGGAGEYSPGDGGGRGGAAGSSGYGDGETGEGTPPPSGGDGADWLNGIGSTQGDGAVASIPEIEDSGTTTLGGGSAPETNGEIQISYIKTGPSAPTNVQITDDTVEDELTLNWDSVSDATGYYVYRAEDSGTSKSDYTQVADVTSPPYTDTGLEDGEQYYYRVSSHD